MRHPSQTGRLYNEMADPTPQDLSTRKAQILRAVIVEYVRGAEPIASDLIAQKYELGVRSATIRAEMADITDLGFLEQPHTSAGRIPSDTGYRYYVDHLLNPVEATEEEKSRVRSAQEEEETLKELLVETTKVLSRMTSLCAAAATVKDSSVQVKHGILTVLGPGRGLLVLVLGNGHVENRLVEIPPTATIEQIGMVNEAIMNQLVGLSLGSLTKFRFSATGNPALESVFAEAGEVIRSVGRDLTKGHFITDGEEYVLAKPEFIRDHNLLDSVVKSLEDQDTLRSAIIGTPPIEERTTIGREHGIEELRPLAITRRIFFVGDQEAGALAIIGPTRMNYDHGITLLDHTAKAVSQTLTKLFS